MIWILKSFVYYKIYINTILWKFLTLKISLTNLVSWRVVYFLLKCPISFWTLSKWFPIFLGHGMTLVSEIGYGTYIALLYN